MSLSDIVQVMNFFLDLTKSFFNFFMQYWITSILFLTALVLFVVNSFIAPTGLTEKGRAYIGRHRGDK